jgi:FixJ family two-component response regulator
MASIAIADDDEAVRESLAVLIEAHGFQAYVFATGRALLDGQASRPADCILVDRHMPQITGLDVLEQLRASGDLTPVILMTGLPDSGLRAKARSLGAFSVLYKPLTQAELMIALHGALATGRR